MKLNLNFYNSLGLEKGEKKLIKKISKIFSQLIDETKNQRETLNLLSNKYKFNFKISEFKKFKKFKTIAVIGMGGSILGVEAIHNFLEFKIKKKVYFFNNLDENKIIDFKNKENLSKVLFIIISKSGHTIETITNTFLMKIVKKNSKNLIIVSEKNNSFLYLLAKKFNLFYVEHKKTIGGRYSVLSEVGIVPAYLMGINIIKLRANIMYWFKGSNKIFLKKSSVKLSKFMNSKKYTSLVFLNYSPQLEKFLYWCQQLIAESLGKKGKGFLPIVSPAPKDHHSLLQLYLDGPKNKIYTIFSDVNNSLEKIKIEKKIDSKNLLQNKTLKEIITAQKRALIKTLKNKTIPFREFIILKNNEEVLGLLFSYFILETIAVGKLSNIDPFSQPAVEEVKKYTKKLLI